MKFSRVTEVAEAAARAGAKVVRQGIGRVSTIDYKSAFNIVTDVDKASEKKVLEVIRKEFPNDDVLAEEGGDGKSSGSKRRWLVDPLDGTTNFSHAYPFFAVSVGVEEDGKLISGVVCNPANDEIFVAEAGRGAYLNGKKIRVSSISRLGKALLATGFPYDTRTTQRNNMEQFRLLTDLSHGVRRDGAAALDLCFVACGRLDGFWEMKLSPWDTAAGVLIVTEAGGKVSSLQGSAFDINQGPVLATNGIVHDQVLAVLAQTNLMRHLSMQASIPDAP